MLALTPATHSHLGSTLALVGLGLFALSQVPPTLPGPYRRLQPVAVPIWGAILVAIAGALCAFGAWLARW